MKKSKKITIVMATYKRNDFIADPDHPTIKLVKNELIDKIVIVWQNIGEKVPAKVINNLELHCKDKYVFEFPKINSMNNRFINYNSIETDFVMVVDDDYNATEKSMIAMHDQLIKDEDILTGCVPRHITTATQFKYDFDPERKIKPFNFILLGYSMFHKKFLDLYQLDKTATKMVDDLFNADDIYFNYMHQKYSKSQQPKVLISDIAVNTWKIVPGTSISDQGDHLKKRESMCRFLESKGYNLPVACNKRISLNDMNINIDYAYWINLEKSKERRQQFENEVLNVLGSDGKLNFIRFPGLDLTSESYVGRRAAGCSFSHLSCWRDAYRKNLKYVVMFEDDFKLTVSKEKFEKTIEDLILNHPDFIVCNIGYNRTENENDKTLSSGFFRYNDIQTTSAYIANVDFLMKMYPYVMDAAMNLIVFGEARTNAIDRIWKIFQHDERWLCSERLGVQRSSYSEIERKNVDYQS